METHAHRKEGSNKHIKGCERTSERFKLEIRCGRVLGYSRSKKTLALANTQLVRGFDSGRLPTSLLALTNNTRRTTVPSFRLNY
ncbi:hypothetical protein R1sor_017368 [Riccia sorocarpa]|uniref:Ribosomal protein S14 n=1 Tax=Riccia sorocarpa TaxID=122646 RepID=A0ABD3I7Q7_9MARC